MILGNLAMISDLLSSAERSELNGQSRILSSDKLGNCLIFSTSDQVLMAVFDTFNLIREELLSGTEIFTTGQSARLREQSLTRRENMLVFMLYSIYLSYLVKFCMRLLMEDMSEIGLQDRKRSVRLSC